MLEKINGSFDNVKYIEQFSLLQNDEGKFEELMSRRHSKLSENFLKEFKDAVEDVAKIDIKQNEKDIEDYLSTLIKFANENEKADSFSKAALFSESLFSITSQESLRKIIESTTNLIDNTEYKEIIERHIQAKTLKELALDLIKKYNETEDYSLKKKWLNYLLVNIKEE